MRVMAINITSLIGIRLLGVVILTRYFHAGLVMIWLMLSIELFLRGGLMFGWFAWGKWKTIRV